METRSYPLGPRETSAISHLIARIRSELDAELVQASLFGSRARGEARPDSDFDILLIFRDLPPGREPYAGQAEEIAEEVAGYSGLPVSVWSVSLEDVRSGNRTPMLVDALEDSHVLWASAPGALPPIAFTPLDAAFCARSLLERVGEGSEEFARFVEAGEYEAAGRRLRDDLVRLCTGHLLLSGWTRPRRAEVVDAFLRLHGADRWPSGFPAVMRWVADSFGADGRHADGPVRPPRPDVATARRVLEAIHERLVSGLAEVERDLSRTAARGDGMNVAHSRSQHLRRSSRADNKAR